MTSPRAETGVEPPVSQPDQRTIRTAVATASIGNAIEWFDFGIYSLLAVTIGAVFFPESSPAVQLISTFGIFAASFIFRPLGGWFFGSLGDRIGRRRTLSATILLMSFATLGIGLIPSHDSIGIVAPILLVVCRMAQGFSTGGEWAGAAVFVSEYAPAKRRSRMGCFIELGSLGGFAAGALLCTAIISWMPPEDLLAWGWRIPFLIAAPLGVVGYFMRLRLDETPAFRELAEQERTTSSPLVSVLKTHRGALGRLVAIIMLDAIVYYTVLAYMPTYLSQTLDIGESGSLWIVLGMVGVMMALLLPLGRLADRIGNKPLLLAWCLGFLILSYPAFLIIQSGNTLGIIAGMAILGFLMLLMEASLPSTIPRMFPTAVRFVAVAVGYNLAATIFGGTAPLVMQSLISFTGINSVPAFYLMAAAAIALVPILRTPETAGPKLPKDDAGHPLL